jgi:hypothetical protein
VLPLMMSFIQSFLLLGIVPAVFLLSSMSSHKTWMTHIMLARRARYDGASCRCWLGRSAVRTPVAMMATNTGALARYGFQLSRRQASGAWFVHVMHLTSKRGDIPWS